jgi:hypothetical protein
VTGQVDIQGKTAQPRDEALAFARRLDAALRSSLVPGSFIVGGDVPYSMLASAPFKLIPAGGGAPVRNDMVVVREIAPGALDFFRIRLIRGREFQESDDRSAPPVALVNETFVRRFARGQEVIGATLDGGPDRPSPTIVGVVADVRDSALSRPATEALYLPSCSGRRRRCSSRRGGSDSLAHFKAPHTVTFLAELPKTATGKIQKFVLRGGRAGIAHQ